MKISRYIKLEWAASAYSISYSAAVVSLSILARSCAAFGISACAACAGLSPASPAAPARAPAVFYTVTGEIALSRHEARVAALQYAAAAETARDEVLLARATEVTADCLQPSLTWTVAGRWMTVAPASVDAHRAAGKAALELHDIEHSALQYRSVLTSSPRGTATEFQALESDLMAVDNIYGARQLADRLAQYFPDSLPALRLQAFTALRADDPAAAVHSFQAALAKEAGPPEAADRRDLTLGLWRARVLSGDAEEPLASAKAAMDRDPTPSNRLEYAVLLMAAQNIADARSQLHLLTLDPESKPAALRLLGLLDMQDGNLTDASVHFAELATTGQFLDDSLYYLGQIAERHEDLERALRLYSQVQSGDNAVAALLRAASILRSHGAAPAAEELLDQLVDEEPKRAPELLVARARIYSTAGDVPQAAAVLEQAQLEYPDSVEVRYAMATMSEDQGKVADALRELKAIAASRPADPAALNAYGYTLADNNRQLRVARRLIEQAYAATPKNAAILDSLGWVLFRQGHGEQALPYLNEAYADEHDGDIAAHLGEVLWRLGRRSDAERIWSEASRADSDNPLLKSTQLRLRPAN